VLISTRNTIQGVLMNAFGLLLVALSASLIGYQVAAAVLVTQRLAAAQDAHQAAQAELAGAQDAQERAAILLARAQALMQRAEGMARPMLEDRDAGQMSSL
jgi:hypothetical protein